MRRYFFIPLAACVCLGLGGTAEEHPTSALDLLQVQQGRANGPVPRPGNYEEPAFARGYADGFRRGADSRRNHGRYDPLGGGDYRDADQGYLRSYGPRDAYRNNYRAGYRQGYEDGFRGRRTYRWR